MGRLVRKSLFTWQKANKQQQAVSHFKRREKGCSPRSPNASSLFRFLKVLFSRAENDVCEKKFKKSKVDYVTSWLTRKLTFGLKVQELNIKGRKMFMKNACEENRPTRQRPRKLLFNQWYNCSPSDLVYLCICLQQNNNNNNSNDR